MNFARVIGNIWATQKDPNLTGLRMLIIQPLTSDGKEFGSRLIGCDTVQAGPGDHVYYVTSNESVFPIPPDFAPVDCSIVGLVDRLDRPELEKISLPVSNTSRDK
ncbi:MAG: EutN/CcmL family microcompartment protein [bacterium]|nr:EutN/CcmL family microcompartment protein [bacterium]